uniref:Cell division protein ZapB n=1 Tax=Candidatus Kentrum sp. LFY TaxID=2126342 RepID=A0A450WUC6_9GAMM|nr:MAG: cell division protein ZapB [Candidatus Kentron sp. LFY]
MQELERRIDVLIRAYDGLKRENRTLQEQKIDLIAERVVLIEKLKLAKLRIEDMVAQLKLMETGSWDGES